MVFKEGLRFVTGRGRYIDDVVREYKDVYHVRILRSNYAHAKINSIDTTDAEKLPGVIKVITFKDVKPFLDPFPLSLDTNVEYYPLAKNKVVYYGEPIAVVVAKDEYIAEDAKELIQVDYQPLKPIVSIEDAIKSSPIHEGLGSNIVLNKILIYGKFEEVMKKVEITVESKIKFPRYSSSPLETYEVFSRFNGDEYEIYSNFQGPFSIHYILTKALKSRVILRGPRDIGGSFGIKSAIYPYLALIAVTSRIVNKPVKWVETRSEHIIASSTGAERESRVRIYGNKQGKIYAIEMEMVDNLGAYPRPPEPGNLLRTHGNISGAYDIEALKINYKAVLTNTLPTGLNRGYGGPHLYLALESAVDDFANEIGMDPIDVRLKNVIKQEEYETLTGGRYYGFSCYKVLSKMREIYKGLVERSMRYKNRGVGVSLIIEPSGTNVGYLDLAREGKEYLPKSSAQDIVIVQIDPYGKVNVIVNGTNEGQGHETAISQIVARRLGINENDIDVIYSVDTSRPWVISSGTYSSRFTPIIIKALEDALSKLEDTILSYASELLGIQKSQLRIENGRVVTISGDKSMSLKSIIGTFYWNPAKLKGFESGLVAVGYYQSPLANELTENKINSSISYGCLGHIVELEIDEETRLPKVLDYYIIHDSGKILNEQLAKGQLLGSTFHGVEVALYASLDYSEDGIPISQTFADYGVMSIVEGLRDVKIINIESNPNHITGLGEGGTMAAPPAIVNAIKRILRVKDVSLPLYNYMVNTYTTT